MLLNIFQFTHRNFIGNPFFCFVFTNPFHVLPALDPAPDQYMPAYFKSRSISGISSPAYTWYVIGFSVRSIDCHQKICDLSSQRCFSVYRRFTDISVQKDLIDRHSFPQTSLPGQRLKAQAGFSFLHDGYRIGTVRGSRYILPHNPV